MFQRTGDEDLAAVPVDDPARHEDCVVTGGVLDKQRPLSRVRTQRHCLGKLILNLKDRSESDSRIVFYMLARQDQLELKDFEKSCRNDTQLEEEAYAFRDGKLVVADQMGCGQKLIVGVGNHDCRHQGLDRVDHRHVVAFLPIVAQHAESRICSEVQLSSSLTRSNVGVAFKPGAC